MLSSTASQALCSFLAATWWWMWRSWSCHQRCQKQTALWQCEQLWIYFLTRYPGLPGVSLQDALQSNQIHNLNRYTSAGMGLTEPSNSTEVPLGPQNLLLLILHCPLLTAFGPSLTDIWKCFPLISNFLGCNFPFFYFCLFCVSCFRYIFFKHKSNFIRLLQGLND